MNNLWPSTSKLAASPAQQPLHRNVRQTTPLLSLNINTNELIFETINLIHSARLQMELLTNTINERFNQTSKDVLFLSNY